MQVAKASERRWGRTMWYVLGLVHPNYDRAVNDGRCQTLFHSFHLQWLFPALDNGRSGCPAVVREGRPIKSIDGPGRSCHLRGCLLPVQTHSAHCPIIFHHSLPSQYD